MEYFIPTNVKCRIYPNDKVKMANLSSRGIQPQRITKGFTLLKWGKTYRDEQITSFKNDIMAGYITKISILDELPKKFRQWMWNKIKDTPYDVEYKTSNMLIDMRLNDLHRSIQTIETLRKEHICRNIT